MSKFGGWEIKVSEGMPQKVASAMGKLDELLGAKYIPVLYLGSQVVNGTNHAVLAEQTVITGEDSKNAVIVVVNEKPNSMDAAVVDIHRIVESGGKLGGTKIEMSTEIPAEAQEAFDKAREGFVGSNIKPIAYIGSKITKGIEYKLLVIVEPVVPNPVSSVAVLTVNSMDKKMTFEDVL
jgi:hypothetical protein